jgi:hypothetical protein
MNTFLVDGLYSFFKCNFCFFACRSAAELSTLIMEKIQSEQCCEVNQFLLCMFNDMRGRAREWVYLDHMRNFIYIVYVKYIVES